jgi:DNA-binding beta-propeller fold protein YncE
MPACAAHPAPRKSCPTLSGEVRWLLRPAGLLWVGFLHLAPGLFAATNTLVWPAPPDVARIAFVESITTPRTAGARLPALKKLANWITGDHAGNEPFRKPFGIALDERGNLCLTDTGANTVSFFDRKEKKWHRWNAVGKLRFGSPVGVAKQGELLYVADSDLGAVIVFDVKGKLRQVITNALDRPVAVALLRDQLYVVDAQRHCVQRFDLAGVPQAAFGRRGSGEGEFNYPTHLAAAGDRLYVTDSMNSRVQVLDGEGRFVAQLGRAGKGAGQFSRPKGVAVDAGGRVWVVDGMADNFQGFDPSGRLLIGIGAQGTAAGEFWLPNGIAVSPAGELYIADSYNRRVQRFQLLSPP